MFIHCIYIIDRGPPAPRKSVPPESALAPNAPKVHETGNTLMDAVIRKGEPEKAFSECQVILEDYFDVPFQEHAFLETQNGVAQLKAHLLVQGVGSHPARV